MEPFWLQSALSAACVLHSPKPYRVSPHMCVNTALVWHSHCCQVGCLTELCCFAAGKVIEAPSVKLIKHQSCTSCCVNESSMLSLLHCRYVTPNEGKPSTVWFYITPLDQHNCRVFSHSVGCDPIPKPISWLLSKRPRWLDHLVLNEVRLLETPQCLCD